MNQPTECRWCGCGVLRSWGPDTIFTCLAMSHPRGEWSQSTECKLKGLEDRIKRAVDKLKKAERYTVTPVSHATLWWDCNSDGPVTDSAAVDEALAILEGERDER